MKNPLFLLILISLFLTSCTTYKNIPINFHLENRNGLKDYLNSKNIQFDTNDLYVIKDFKSFMDFSTSKKLTIPNILFFNSDGYLVKNKFNNRECSQVVDDIEQINSSEYEKEVQISDWLKDMKPISNENDSDTKYDYYIIIDWAKYTDELNSQSFEWYNDIKNKIDSKSNIKCILLNLDVLEEWNLTDAQKQKLDIPL